MNSGRPRKYDATFNARFPGRLAISKDNQGRAKFYKAIIRAANDDELVTMAFDALQEKLSGQFPCINIQNMPSYIFSSSNKQEIKNKILQPASADKVIT